MFSLLIATLITTNAVTPEWREPRPGECVWQRCGLKGGKMINCDEQEIGTTNDLALVQAATKTGSVKYQCAPVAK